MSALVIEPGKRRGPVKVPPSKSHAQRVMLANFLAGAPMAAPEGSSADILAMERCLAALNGETCTPELNCGESGATLRFLAPVAAALGKRPRFVVRGSLTNRPIVAYDGLVGGVHEVEGAVSSQFVSGLLFALPLLKEDSEVRLVSPLGSQGYVDMTIDVLAKAGIVIEKMPAGFRVPGGQRYLPQPAAIEGDWSGGAFWQAMNALGSEIDIAGLSSDSLQPDRAIAGLLKGFPREIDVSPYPDLYPVLRVVAAAKSVPCVFKGTDRLRLKESDRLAAMDETVTKACGGRDGRFRGGEYRTFGDHRIAMALAVMATHADSPVILDDPECVSKSYPSFFSDFTVCECF